MSRASRSLSGRLMGVELTRTVVVSSTVLTNLRFFRELEEPYRRVLVGLVDFGVRVS